MFKSLRWLSFVLLVLLVAAGCGAPTPEVMTVVVTQEGETVVVTATPGAPLETEEATEEPMAAASPSPPPRPPTPPLRAAATSSPPPTG